MKHKDENAKNPDWQVPMKMKGAGKNAYNITMNASSGTQNSDADISAGSGNPAGDTLKTVSKNAKKLTHQSGKSG